MNSSDIAFAVVALIGLVLPWLVLAWAFRCQARMYDGLSGMLDRAGRDQSMIVSELIAHRTLAETGNQYIAGTMLQHSNAHGYRQARPQPQGSFTPAQPANNDPVTGPHDDVTIQYGDDFEMEVPKTGEET